MNKNIVITVGFFGIMCILLLKRHYFQLRILFELNQLENVNFDYPDTSTPCLFPNCPKMVSGDYTHGIPQHNFRFLRSSTSKFNEQSLLQVKPGGSWQPIDCGPTNEPIAVIVPLRGRHLLLEWYLSRIHPFLQQQKIPYTIVTLNQTGDEEFNRGALFNLGFLHAPDSINCFVLSDVDMIPDKYDNMFTCNQSYPRRMAASLSNGNYIPIYYSYMGGIISITRSQYREINGFSNRYWGWGGEDDDLYNRVMNKFKYVDRVSDENGRITHFNHGRDESAKPNPERFKLLTENYDYDADGLNTVNQFCTILSIDLYPLRTDYVIKCSNNDEKKLEN